MTKQTIFYLVRDCGDGSAIVDFFDSQKAANLALEHNPDEYNMNEGQPGKFEVDGTITFGPFTDLYTEASVLQDLKDQGLFEEH